MSMFKGLRGVAVAACAAVGLLALAGAASAAPIYLCLAEKAGTAKSGGLEGKCPLPTAKVKYAKVALPSEESEQQKLLAILPYIKYVGSGVGGKPTIQFSGVNVQIVNGAGQTTSTNGAGNLVIGYDETSGPGSCEGGGGGSPVQTGSHNVILGTNQRYTSYGAILGGYCNLSTGPGELLAGSVNAAEGEGSTISGGRFNSTGGAHASVGGGAGNLASGLGASISGGFSGQATGEYASVSGGNSGYAEGKFSAVSGGRENSATSEASSVSGGEGNTASTNRNASVSGGALNVASGYAAWVGGGFSNVSKGNYASILGGNSRTELVEFGHLP